MNGILLRAMESKQPIEVIYMSSKGQMSQRTIRVLSVTDLHVKAYYYAKKQIRKFRKYILSGQHKLVIA